MPQMAPLWWMLFFMTFILSLMMIHTLMYYTYNKMPPQKEDSSLTNKNINWKW